MGEASRRKEERRAARASTAELLDQLAVQLRADGTALPAVLQGLLARGVTMGTAPPPPAPPKDCPGCKFARELAQKQGVAAELATLILGALHEHQDHAAGAIAAPELPLDVLAPMALSKGLAITRVGPWRVVLQHLEGVYLLSVRMEALRSTVEDWQQLGAIVARLGAPDREPLVPINKLPPDHAITWRWAAPAAPGGLAPGEEDAN